jgi:hypothetical protein
MKTIRKNTKEFNEVLNMKNWNEFSLENCFKPEVVESINVDYAMSFLKLQKDNGKYILSIHSNRWFELSVN